tara:strand:+ start:43 stop:1065 length:1023 start_codon:yes stop_codon:yes gene_type:complete
MAVLSSKTTSGELAFDKYVKNNSKWKELELVIETKLQAILYSTDKKKLLKILKEKTKFNLKENTLTLIDSINYVKVEIENEIGYIPINKIRKPTKTNVMEAEETAIKDLDKLIKNLIKQSGPPDICVKIGTSTIRYSNIGGVRNVIEKVLGREAKSDFCIINSKNKDMIHISHKKVGGPEAYQQYGGISNKSGTSQKPKLIYDNDEVQIFLEKATKYIENDKLIQPIYTPVKNKKLINQAVFGPNYGGDFGIDNVQIIGQGNPILTPRRNDENCFELTFSSHTSFNGDADFFQSGNYKAVLGATYRAGRGFDYKNKRYIGARIGIYPIALIKNRNKAIEI